MSDERFCRSRILYGDEAQIKIEAAKIAVCGVGAVGSFAIEALARIGVGAFELFDFDKVEITNINRQLAALSSTIGRGKAEVIAERIKDINPNAQVKVSKMFIDAQNCADVINCGASVIVDAIDSLASKTVLIAAALKAGVPIVSSMGAARKTDPSLIATAELFKTFNCPMAARMRKTLRAEGFKKANMCVFSTEIPPRETHVSKHGEPKKIGSTPIVTGAFGLHLARLALDEILKDG